MYSLTPIEFIEKFKAIADVLGNEHKCFKFHGLLKTLFPQAKPYHDWNHVITEIDGKFYDLTGEVDQGKFMPVDAEKEPIFIIKDEEPARVTW